MIDKSNIYHRKLLVEKLVIKSYWDFGWKIDALLDLQEKYPSNLYYSVVYKYQEDIGTKGQNFILKSLKKDLSTNVC